MRSKDELLAKAEDLAKSLPDSWNELKRVLHFYLRYGNFKLLDYPLPRRGKKEVERWKKIKEALKKEGFLAEYRHDEVAFILGWASRLVKG